MPFTEISFSTFVYYHMIDLSMPLTNIQYGTKVDIEN